MTDVIPTSHPTPQENRLTGDAIWTRLTVFASGDGDHRDPRFVRLVEVLDSFFEEHYDEEGDDHAEGVSSRSWAGTTGWGVSDLHRVWDPSTGAKVDVVEELVALGIAFAASSEAKYDNAAQAVCWRPGWRVVVARYADQDGTPVIGTRQLLGFVEDAADLVDLRRRIESYLNPWVHGPLEQVD